MSENTGTIRLSKVAKEIGVGIGTIVEHLGKKGQKIESNPNTKITDEQYQLLLTDFQSDKKTKDDVKLLIKKPAPKKEEVVIAPPVVKVKEVVADEEEDDDGILIKSSGLAPDKKATAHPIPPVTPSSQPATPIEEPKSEPPVVTVNIATSEEDDKPGLKVIGKINLVDLEPKSKEKKGKKTEKIAEKEAEKEIESKGKTPKKTTKKETEETEIAAEVKVETPTVVPVVPIVVNSIGTIVVPKHNPCTCVVTGDDNTDGQAKVINNAPVSI